MYAAAILALHTFYILQIMRRDAALQRDDVNTTPHFLFGMTQKGLWIIGYGSLIFRPPPLYAFRVTGTLTGYIRRFWQSSSDHRGTPQSPGRVVTLILLEDLQANHRLAEDALEYEFRGYGPAHTWTEQDLNVSGVAYYIEPKNVAAVQEYMEIREQDGYSTHVVHFNVHSYPKNDAFVEGVLSQIPLNGDRSICIESTVYIGTLANKSFVGPEHITETSKIIRSSKGPSGRNIDYLRQLTDAVRELDSQGVKDAYLEKLLALSL